MHLKILGCGTIFHTDGSPMSSYLVDTGSQRILMDCGPGAVAQLHKANIPLDSIDVILFSHYVHPDHVSDLLPFLASIIYKSLEAPTRSKNLKIFGPKGMVDFYNGLLALSPMHNPKGWAIEVQDILPDRSAFEVGGDKIEAMYVQHGGAAAVGYRINDTLAYSGDTGACDILPGLFRDCALSIIECTATEAHHQWDGHLNAIQVGQYAQAAGTKEVILVHRFTDMGTDAEKVAEVQKNFKGKVHLGEPLQDYPLLQGR